MGDGGPLILYDGQCALCSGAVRFLLRRDRARRLRFAPLAGAAAASVLARHPEIAGLDSMVYVDRAGDRVLVRSDAVLAAGVVLGGGWAAVARAAHLLPAAGRDAVYRLFARLRHRAVAGGACPVVPAEWPGRFLD